MNLHEWPTNHSYNIFYLYWLIIQETHTSMWRGTMQREFNRVEENSNKKTPSDNTNSKAKKDKESYCRDLSKKLPFLKLPSDCKALLGNHSNNSLNRHNSRSKEVWGSVFHPGLNASNRRYSAGHGNNQSRAPHSDNRSTFQMRYDSVKTRKKEQRGGHAASQNSPSPAHFKETKYHTGDYSKENKVDV